MGNVGVTRPLDATPKPSRCPPQWKMTEEDLPASGRNALQDAPGPSGMKLDEDAPKRLPVFCRIGSRSKNETLGGGGCIETIASASKCLFPDGSTQSFGATITYTNRAGKRGHSAPSYSAANFA